MSITVSAPGKLMLFGEHAVVYGHPCIVTAVDQRMTATLEQVQKQMFTLVAPDVGIEMYEKPMGELGRGEMPKNAGFVEMAVKNFFAQHPMQGGIRIETRSQFKSTFGFGSSSAVTVCVIKGLSALPGLQLSPREIFALSYKTVLDVQGKGSGFDIAAAIYGGTLSFAAGGKTIEPLTIDHLPLVVGYTGIKADTVTIINEVKALAEAQPGFVERVYKDMHDLVEASKEALARADWKTVGESMNKNQGYLDKLGVSSPMLDILIQTARDAGAYGAKLSGAGKGDCMIAIAEDIDRQKIGEAINHAGGQWIDVRVGAEGARIE